MKTVTYMIAAAMVTAIPYGALAAQTSQPPLGSAPAEAPAPQAVKPMAGDALYDKLDEQIGTVTSVADQQVVVTTARGKITIPLTSLFAGSKGLAINMTKGEVDAAIQSAH